jgi:hypothetical protein
MSDDQKTITGAPSTPTTPPQGAAPTGDTTGATQPKSGGDEARFTQTDVDRIITERLARERQKTEEEAKKARSAAEEKALAEQQKFQELAEKRARELAEAQSQMTAMQAEREKERLRSAVEREATALGFADPEDAALLADLSKVVAGEKGYTGIKEALEDLLKRKPHLKKSGNVTTTGVPPTPTPTNGQISDDERRKQASNVRRYW